MLFTLQKLPEDLPLFPPGRPFLLLPQDFHQRASFPSPAPAIQLAAANNWRLDHDHLVSQARSALSQLERQLNAPSSPGRIPFFRWAYSLRHDPIPILLAFLTLLDLQPLHRAVHPSSHILDSLCSHLNGEAPRSSIPIALRRLRADLNAESCASYV